MASRLPSGAPAPSEGEGRERLGPLFVLLIVLVLTLAVRVRLADVPLERDEGEYAYAGQLILEGVPPYRLAYNMKFPGTYYAYAAILALFGGSARGIHLGLAAVNAGTLLALFFLARRLMGGFGAAVAAGAFAVLAVDPAIGGAFAHATHFVLLPAILGLLVLDRALVSRSAAGTFASGALLGIAVLMKQHAIFFIPLGVALVLGSELRRKPRDFGAASGRAAVLAGGAALPLAAMGAVLWAQDVFGKFWFWTFVYAREYVSEIPLREALPKLLDGFLAVIPGTWPIWIAAGLGAALLWRPEISPRARALLAGLAAASFLSILPGFFFRRHYFVVMLAPVALLAGVAASAALRALASALAPRMARRLVAAALVVAAGAYIVSERDYLFTLGPRALSRARYGGNPFVESVEIARYIRERTTPADRIAVLGSEPQIYFYAGRRSATGYIYTYALMESQKFAARMQAEMMREIEAARPKYVVRVEIASSWLAKADSDRRIFAWAEQYLRENYDLVGITDIVSTAATTVVWDDGVRDYRPRSPRLLSTFRRKDAAPSGPGS